MNVLLVQPIKEKRHTLNLMPPLGLGYVAEAIRQRHKVTILDCVKEEFSLNDFLSYLKDNKPDVIGFTVFSCDLENVRKSISLIKETFPDMLTVVGGPHPSCDPEGTFGYLDKLDFAFAGEAEIGFPVFLDALEAKRENILFPQIPGLVYRHNGRINRNKSVLSENLDSLGFPSWDLIRPDTYRGVPNGVFTKQNPFAPIIATRGCPYLCTFCAAHNIVGRKIRSRSIDNVIKEIELLHDAYGIREIHIEDDNFTFNIAYAKEFCRRIIAMKLGITFSCPNWIRLDRVDKELLMLMKKAGFYNIYVGVESGSEKILKHMKKSLSLQEISDKVDLIKECGLEASAYFILGYPEETLDDINKTIKYAKSLNLDWAQFATFIPLPGSEISASGGIKDCLKNSSYGDYFNTEVPYAPAGISREQLKKLQRQAFLSFYLRPGKIKNLLRKINRHNWKLILRRVASYILS